MGKGNALEMTANIGLLKEIQEKLKMKVKRKADKIVGNSGPLNMEKKIPRLGKGESDHG